MAGVVVSVPTFSGWGSHSRNLPADSWPAHSQCASRYLLPALLPLGGQLQRGSGRVSHDAASF